jgi:hypothetical protein
MEALGGSVCMSMMKKRLDGAAVATFTVFYGGSLHSCDVIDMSTI